MAETDNLDDDDLLDGMEAGDNPLEDLDEDALDVDVPEGEDPAEETTAEDDEDEVPDGRLEKLKSFFTRKRLMILGAVLLSLLVLVFGITDPGGAYIVTKFFLAFVAPQTTFAFSPFPKSTLQSFNLSALGCFSTFKILAILKSLKLFELSFTVSTSSPILVKPSIILLRLALVLR